ncbi:hypothetical protein FOZ63_030498, partial [Perkinsus olseni]
MLSLVRPCPLNFIRTANGGTCKILGVLDLDVCFYVLPPGREPSSRSGPTKDEVVPGPVFPVCMIVIDSLSVDMLLGMDFLRHFGMGLMAGMDAVRLSVPQEFRKRMSEPNILDWLVNSADPVVMTPSIFVGEGPEDVGSLRPEHGSVLDVVAPANAATPSISPSSEPVIDSGRYWLPSLQVPVPKMVSKEVQVEDRWCEAAAEGPVAPVIKDATGDLGDDAKSVTSAASRKERPVTLKKEGVPDVEMLSAEQLGCGTEQGRLIEPRRLSAMLENGESGGSVRLTSPIVCILSVAPRWTKEELRNVQQADPTLSLVFERRLDPAPLARNELIGPELMPYKKIWGQLDVVDGVLVRLVRPLPDDKPRLVPVVPQAIRSEVLLQFHDDDGHFGKERVGQKLTSLCYWPGMLTAVADYICECRRCKEAKKKVVPPMDLVTIP